MTFRLKNIKHMDSIKNLTENFSNNPIHLKNLSAVVLKNKFLTTTRGIDHGLCQKPINLLFSMDQFVYEMAKKSTQPKKSSEFFQQLKERKKLTLFYAHLPKRRLANIMNQANRYPGYFSKNFFSLMERRLDVALYRSNIILSIPLARQLITHKKIKVNSNIINEPNYFLKPGDVVSIDSGIWSKLSIDLLQKSKAVINGKVFTPFTSNPLLVKSQTISLTTKLGGLFSKNNTFGNSKKFSPYFLKGTSKKIVESATRLLLSKLYLRAFIFSKPLFLWDHSDFLTLLKYKLLLHPESKTQTWSLVKNQSKIPQLTTLYLSKNKYNNPFKKKQTKFAKDKFVSKKFFEAKGQKKPESVLFTPKNLVLCKHFLLQLQGELCVHKSFHDIFYLKLKTEHLKTRYFKTPRKLNVVKPIHLEISYKLLSFIFLYSPQRIEFPFSLNTDLILRSLR